MRYSFTLAEDALLLFDSLTNNGSLNWTLTGPSGVIDGRNFNNSVAYQRDDATPFFAAAGAYVLTRSEEHTSELQSLMRNSYAVFCLKKKNTTQKQLTKTQYNTRK